MRFLTKTGNIGSADRRTPYVRVRDFRKVADELALHLA
jgi:hypothetical protein